MNVLIAAAVFVGSMALSALGLHAALLVSVRIAEKRRGHKPDAERPRGWQYALGVGAGLISCVLNAVVCIGVPAAAKVAPRDFWMQWSDYALVGAAGVLVGVIVAVRIDKSKMERSDKQGDE